MFFGGIPPEKPTGAPCHGALWGDCGGQQPAQLVTVVSTLLTCHCFLSQMCPWFKAGSSFVEVACCGPALVFLFPLLAPRGSAALGVCLCPWPLLSCPGALSLVPRTVSSLG